MNTRRSTSEDDAIALRLVACLNDDQVLQKMKAMLYPQELENKIDNLTKKIDSLTKLDESKNLRLNDLEKRISTLEANADRQEQYSRRPNLRVQGLEEKGEGENTDRIMIQLINDTLAVVPPLEIEDIERSHRLGPKTNKDGQPRTRPVIVRFRSERVRDTVYRARTKLKIHNNENRGNAIYINEDLTAFRASLAYLTRDLKKTKRINDCWTSQGNILIKDLANKVININNKGDLGKY